MPDPEASARPATLGRDSERSVIRAFLDRALTGGGALILEGDAGVGKTHLLRDAIRMAEERGSLVLAASGSQYEADLSFGVLHQLLLPVVDDVGRIGQVKAEALRAALGIGGESGRTGPLAAYDALLDLLSLLARQRPLLLAIDDLQWLDASTSAAAAFVARRARARRIALVGTVRVGEMWPLDGEGIHTHRVPPLAPSAADRLLSERHPSLSSTTRRSVVSMAAGYPLALLEWGAEIEQGTADGVDRSIGELPLPRRLEATFVSRWARLPVRTRQELLALALDGRSAIRDLVGVGLSLERLAPAERLGAVVVDEQAGTIGFRHPLMKSAVVGASTSAQRRRAHLRLAARQRDPDRRAWHHAAAATGPDEEVARELEQLARRCSARGDAAGAESALTSAAELSPDGTDRFRRLAEAAYLGADVTGEPQGGASILTGSDTDVMTGHGSLYAVAARVQVAVNTDGDHVDALKLLASAVETGDHEWSADDRELVDTLRTWLLLCTYAGDLDSWRAYFAALERLEPEVPEVLHAQSMASGDTVRTGGSARAAIVAWSSDEELCADPAVLAVLGNAALYLDETSAYRRHFARAVREGRRGGPQLPYARALAYLGIDDFLRGRWPQVDAQAIEGKELCDALGFARGDWYFAYLLALTSAGRGRTAEARDWVAAVERSCGLRGSRGALRFAYQPLVLAAIADGDWEEAYRVACRLGPPGEFLPYTPVAMWVAYDLVESAVRTGRETEAKRHADAMVESALPQVSDRMALLTAGATAVADTGDHWAESFEQALAVPGASTWPFDLARIRLVYGERLRRSLQVTAARQQFHAALDVFNGLGAAPWIRRTEAELRASGDVSAREIDPAPPSAGSLTQQERAVAEMAAAGLSNKEIGKRLFLSSRTVSGHLYHAFPKLGITSRAGLRDALSQLGEEGSSS